MGSNPIGATNIKEHDMFHALFFFFNMMKNVKCKTTILLTA